MKHLRVDALQVAEPHYFSNGWRLGAGNSDFNENVPRNEGGILFAVGEYAIIALDYEEVNPDVRPSPELVMGGV